MGSLLIAGKINFNTKYCCPKCGKVSQSRRQGLINNEIVWREYPCGHRVEFTRAEWLIGVAK